MTPIVGEEQRDKMRELRHDPIQKRWVIIAPDRGRRPIELSKDGGDEAVRPAERCPLCPGHEARTPPELLTLPEVAEPGASGWKVRVVPNKYPALRIEGELDRRAHGHYDQINGIGAHEVIVETAIHGLMLAELPTADIGLVLRSYRERLRDLMRDPRFRYVLIFKNHGARAGASLYHSHSQLIATPVTPRTVAVELNTAREHYAVKERCLFCDILQQEMEEQQRIVAQDRHFVTFCPYASRFPFEMTLMPRVHSHDFAALDDDGLRRMARHLKEVLGRMNESLSHPPYNFLLHTAPNTQSRSLRTGYWTSLASDWHWHLEILPQLTSVAGFEWGTGFYINPTAPERAAEHLREVRLSLR